MCKLTHVTLMRAPGTRGQTGASLMELMISLALSLLVTTAMVVLMSNSMGTATRIIQMTQLSDELRNAMSMMTRDLRRSNYSANAAYCYANSDCGIDGSAAQVGDIVIDGGSCMTFNLDRNQDGNASTDPAGGFRLSDAGGVGFLEMWVGDSEPECADDNGGNWVEVTDPDYVDITDFEIDDSNSIVGSITTEGGGTLTQRTRQISIRVEGQLLLDDNITRRLEDTIKVRNDWLN
jgi:type II secretory pathway component PulJ